MISDKPKIFSSAGLAWSDIFRGMTDMPALTTVAVALGLIFGAVYILLAPWIGSVPTTLGALAATVAVSALWSFVLTPLCLAIHRYIILGEVAAGYTLPVDQSRFQHFFLCMLAINALRLLPNVLPGMLGHSGVAAAAADVVAIFCLFVATRLILLLPAIAVDAPDASFRNAFKETQGFFWRIFGILIVTTLPVVAVAVGMFALGNRWAAAKLISTVASVLIVALAVAVASRLYLRLANRQGLPRSGALEAGAARSASC